MSTRSGTRLGAVADRAGTVWPTDADVGPSIYRLLALACCLAMTASYVSVLLEVTAVVGGTKSLLTLIGTMFVVATVAAKVVGPKTATVAAVGGAALGFWYYFSVAGVELAMVLSATDELLSDTLALVTGLPLLRMTEAGIWTLAFVPAPVFLSWYLAVRRRYALSVVPGGAALGFLVLTGDATSVLTLVGTAAGVGVVGFGELEHRRGTLAQVDVLAVLFAAMLVLSLSISVVPGGTTGPQFLVDGGDGGTLEGSVAAAPDRSTIEGSVELSPEVRFTVESDEPTYWRTGVYDRFTGDEWVRTGDESEYDGPLEQPPGRTQSVTQTVTIEHSMQVMPMAAQPIDVEGDIRQNTVVTEHGQFQPASTLIDGDAYTVRSAVLDPRVHDLETAGTNYPPAVTERYLQLPEGTSSEFESHTREVTADADNPYEKAVAIESHLRRTKGYSLEVDRPDGNVAEEFLFEMDEAYCVYFATTMVQMLRAEDVPARYVTGYTEGQQVDDGEWVVRGLDAHAWVEVYFPGHGWVAFEPTPPDPRDAEHAEQLDQAREDGESGVDVDRREDVPEDGPDDDPGSDDPNESEDGTDDESEPIDDDGNQSDASGETNDTDRDSPGDDDDNDADGGIELPSLPPPEQLALGLVVLVGLTAGARRVGATAFVTREVGVHWHGRRRTPAEDVERAYRRLEWFLDRRHRSRRPSETPRQYFDRLSAQSDLDSRAWEVLDRYEQATYGNGVDRTGAQEAITTVDALTRERLPVIGRRWR